MMAPPYKRRKLFDFTSQDDREEEQDSVVSEAPAPFSHAVDSLESTSSTIPPQTSPMPHHVEEIHVRIEQHAAGDAEHLQAPFPRQVVGGSGAASASISSSTDGNSSTSAATTSSDLTSTSITSDSTSSSTTADDAASITSSSSSAVSVLSAALASYDNSTIALLTAASTSATSGVISSSSNSTISAAALSSTTTGGLVSITAATAISTPASNLTISSASRTSYTNASLATLSPSSNNSESFFLATVTGDDVVTTTLNQSSAAYTTTVAGEIFTVPAFSASPTDSIVLLSTTLSDGSASLTTNAPSDSPSSSGQPAVASTAAYGGPAASGQGSGSGQGTETSPPASSPTTDNGTSNQPQADPGTIAGGVVGGAAGLAVILLVAMLFLRWFRRRNQAGHRQLPTATMGSPDPSHAVGSSRGAGMAERAGLMPLVGAVPALFRHQNRSQNRSIEDSEPSERGFTRVSGRKLPSQWSPGMTSSDVLPRSDMPLTAEHNTQPYRNPFETRDSMVFFNGDHRSDEEEPSPPDREASQETMTMSPGPRRQPTIHRGGPYVLASSGTQAPMSPSLDTAESSYDSNRNSRFTEDMP